MAVALDAIALAQGVHLPGDALWDIPPWGDFQYFPQVATEHLDGDEGGTQGQQRDQYRVYVAVVVAVADGIEADGHHEADEQGGAEQGIHQPLLGVHPHQLGVDPLGHVGLDEVDDGAEEGGDGGIDERVAEIDLPSSLKQGGDAAVEGPETEQQNDDAVDDVGDGLEVGIAVLEALIGGASNEIGSDETQARHPHAEQGEDAIEHDGVGADEEAVTDAEQRKRDAAEQRQGQGLFLCGDQRTDNMAVVSHNNPPFKWWILPAQGIFELIYCPLTCERTGPDTRKEAGPNGRCRRSSGIKQIKGTRIHDPETRLPGQFVSHNPAVPWLIGAISIPWRYRKVLCKPVGDGDGQQRLSGRTSSGSLSAQCGWHSGDAQAGPGARVCHPEFLPSRRRHRHQWPVIGRRHYRRSLAPYEPDHGN